jgi:hypothetical protein
VNERWLIAKGNSFAPSWDTLIALVTKMKEEGWLVGPGRAFTTVEKGSKNEEAVPDTIDRPWLDDESREELRMVWKAASGKSPLTAAAQTIEIQRAPDFVYPVRKGIGTLDTECRCSEDLSFEWDEEELTPAFTESTGIYTECEECSRTYDPAKVTAKIVDPVTGQKDEINGGASYRFALKATSAEPATFNPELRAFMEKEFNRSFYEIGAVRP